jgi:diaminohydroxyphosphoribosylaminopyrimidine deaminase/5-amino-6-(5-phosphoribosylamino)uracil reductase
VSYVKLNKDYFLNQILDELYKRNLQSLLVEGGPATHKLFIENNLWDEAHIFTSNTDWGEGVKAPVINSSVEVFNEKLQNDYYQVLKPRL